MERRWLGAARGKPERLRRFHKSIGTAHARFPEMRQRGPSRCQICVAKAPRFVSN